MSGKILRLARLVNPRDGKTIVFPLDHGVSCGPGSCPANMRDTISRGIRGGADALVLHKGMIRQLEGMECIPGVFMHLSASTPLGGDSDWKVLVGSVEEAIRKGVDGVSVHINLGGAREPDMLRDLGRVGDACDLWQMPLLVMVYIRGSMAPSPVPDSAIAHGVRIAAELGADVIKAPWLLSPDSMAAMAASVPVPVVLAGGVRKADPRGTLERVQIALSTGIRGVAMGRHVFQDEHPGALLRAISVLVHGDGNAGDAWERYQSEMKTDSDPMAQN